MSDGYLFVPLPERVSRRRHEAAVFDRRVSGALCGSVNVVFRCEQAVHIGSGFKALKDRAIVRGAARIRGGPGLPGSSLKGALRSRFEAITYSCAVAPQAGKVRSQSHPDIRFARFSDKVRRQGVFQQECGRDWMCPSCALFGRMSQRSRVAVTDFAAEDGTEFEIGMMPEQFTPNLHHLGEAQIIRDERGNDAFEVRSLKGRKFALGRGPVADNAQHQRVEVIPRGSLLRGQLRFFNLLPPELGGLLAALGKEPPSALKIGAGKGHGFGRMRLHSAAFHLRERIGAVEAAEEKGWREAFTDASSDRFALGEQELIRIHEGDC